MKRSNYTTPEGVKFWKLPNQRENSSDSQKQIYYGGPVIGHPAFKPAALWSNGFGQCAFDSQDGILELDMELTALFTEGPVTKFFFRTKEKDIPVSIRTREMPIDPDFFKQISWASESVYTVKDVLSLGSDVSEAGLYCEIEGTDIPVLHFRFQTKPDYALAGKRIAVLGTSNSVLNGGWLAGLQSALPDCEIFNYCVGDSCTSQFGVVMDMDFTAFEFVFIDSIVNDDMAYRRGVIGDGTALNAVIADIYSTIRSQSRLVVIMFPRRDDPEMHAYTYVSRKLLCEEMGIPYVNVLRMAKVKHAIDHRQETSMGDAALFLDEVHILPPIARQAAIDMANNLSGLLQVMPKANPQMLDRRSNFRTLNVPGDVTHNGNVTHLQNRAFSMDVVGLRRGASLWFEAPAGFRLIGLYIDRQHTNGSVDFMYKSELVFRTNLHYTRDRDPNKFTKKFIDLPGGIVCDSIRVSSISRAPVLERTKELNFQDLACDGENHAEPVLALGDLLLWRPQEAFRFEGEGTVDAYIELLERGHTDLGTQPPVRRRQAQGPGPGLLQDLTARWKAFLHRWR